MTGEGASPPDWKFFQNYLYDYMYFQNFFLEKYVYNEEFF
jgi:hypothetical protein